MKDIYYFELIKKSLNRNKYHCFEKNLIYEDAIYEILEEKNIDIVFIMSDVISDYKKLKKSINSHTKIVVFVENYNKSNELIKNGLEFIYDINVIDEHFIKTNILGDKEDIVTEKDLLIDSNKLKEELKFFSNENIKNRKSEIIVFFGDRKSGKTTLSTLTIKNIKEKKKILYIDFNFDNKIGNNFIKKEIGVNTVKCIFNISKFLKNRDFKNELNKFIKQYDLIVIDLNENISFKFIKTIFILANKIFFIIEPIFLEINRSLELLDYFTKEKFINIDKFFIIFNKYDYLSISIEILKEIFKKYKIECVVRNKLKYRRVLNKEVRYEFKCRRE